jgi:hypothetical protein
MKKQFVIYDFSSNLFLASVNEQGVVWDNQPMLFDSDEEANNCLQNAYKLFPTDFNNRLTTVTNVYITEQMILNK